MKKTISSLVIIGMLTFGLSSSVFAQDQATTDSSAQVENVTDSTVQDSASQIQEITTPAQTEVKNGGEEATSDTPKAKDGFVAELKNQFITGGPLWMGLVLITLIVGIALCIERIVYLNLSSINTKNFLKEVEEKLSKKDVEGAKEICRNTRGPIASIFYQGLSRTDEGVDAVEKSVVSYGGIQTGLLDKGISWITLFIALAPMLGFLGTVVGMIMAFAKIVENGQVSPITVAHGIQVALLTTVFGLITAIILQLFYNYIISKVDSIVNEMEDASITLIDLLIKYKVTEKN